MRASHYTCMLYMHQLLHIKMITSCWAVTVHMHVVFASACSGMFLTEQATSITWEPPDLTRLSNDIQNTHLAGKCCIVKTIHIQLVPWCVWDIQSIATHSYLARVWSIFTWDDCKFVMQWIDPSLPFSYNGVLWLTNQNCCPSTREASCSPGWSL